MSVPARLDQMFKVLNPLLQQGASEDRVKAQIEKIISPVVSKQLLDQHAQAHAVDDVRISRTQLQNMLLAWQELGFIQKQLSGTRTLVVNVLSVILGVARLRFFMLSQTVLHTSKIKVRQY